MLLRETEKGKQKKLLISKDSGLLTNKVDAKNTYHPQTFDKKQILGNR